MDIFEVISNRHSNRRFKNIDVEPEKLQKLVESAINAPSAGNLQAYDIFVVKGKELRNALAIAAYSEEFIAQAPVVMVFVRMLREINLDIMIGERNYMRFKMLQSLAPL